MDNRIRKRVAYHFGRVLKQLRDEVGMSQEALAADADIDRTYPSCLERGIRSPTIAVLFKIANALHVDAGKLVQMTERHMDDETEEL